MQDGHVLKGTNLLEQTLDNGGCLANRFDPFRRGLADDPGRQRRSWKRDALEQLGRKPKGLTRLPDAVLAQLNQRLDDAVTEGFLGVDPQLLKDIVLPFYAPKTFR
jgi:hypothetical protein